MLGWTKKCKASSGLTIMGAARNAKALAISPNTLTMVPLDTTIYDYGAFFAADGLVHINEDGVYFISAGLTFVNIADGSAKIWVNKGSYSIMGTTITPTSGAVSNGATALTTGLYPLNKGDALTLCGQHTASSAARISSNCGIAIVKFKDL